MPYLRSLSFVNIQSHKETILDLSPKLNVIKGTSHKGKSSMVRGSEFLIFNEPLAPQDKIKSWFAKKEEEMSVTAGYTDESYVIRTHSPSFNGYLIGNEEEKPLEALRGDVPEEVRAALGIDSLNLRGQNDGYFMLNSSPGEVARMFNQVSGLDIIDKVLSRVNSISRETNASLNSIEKQVIQESASVEKLKFVREVKTEVALLEKRVKRCQQLEQSIATISSSLAIIEKEKEVERVCKIKIGVKPLISSLKLSVSSLESLENRYKALSSVVGNIKKHTKLIEDLNDWLLVKKEAESFREQIKAYEDAKKKHDALFNVCSTIKAHEKKRRTLSLHVSQLQEKRASLHAKLDYCPTCGAHRKYWKNDI